MVEGLGLRLGSRRSRVWFLGVEFQHSIWDWLNCASWCSRHALVLTLEVAHVGPHDYMCENHNHGDDQAHEHPQSHVLTLTDSFADFIRQRLLHGFTPEYEANLYS